jgi:hypothetical protein
MGTNFSDQGVMGGTDVSGSFMFHLMMLNIPLLEGRTWTDVLRHRPLIEMDEYGTGRDIQPWNRDMGPMKNDEYWRVQDWYRPDFNRTDLLSSPHAESNRAAQSFEMGNPVDGRGPCGRLRRRSAG